MENRYIVIMILSGEISNGIGMMLLNLPGGSTLQWATG